MASALKARSRDDSFFFALHAHSIATMFATSQMFTVKDGVVVAHERTGNQVRSHND